MRIDYPECERRVLLSEGGYSNNPNDPGGPTNWGITLVDARLHWKPDATAEDVRNMPRSVAIAIYKTKYWDALNGDNLPAGVDYAVFDYGINSGIGRPGRVLRAVLGLPSHDWHVDEAVLEHLRRADPQHVADAICSERLRFLRQLHTWPTFGGGWGRRIISVKAYSDHLANSAASRASPGSQGVVGPPPPHPETHDMCGKAYCADDAPLCLEEPLPAFLQPKATQTATVDQQSVDPRGSTDTPATLVTPQPDPAPAPPEGLAMLKSKTGWAAIGLGGSGFADGLQNLNDYASQLASFKFSWQELNLTSACLWVLHHPMVLVPIAVIGAAAFVYEDHKKYKRLVQALKETK